MAALAVLSEGEWLTVNDLLEYKVSAATARTLLAKGFVEAGQKHILRNSYVNPQKRGELFTLTDEQAIALEKINASIYERNGKTFLLQGITGSGKTEVYIRAAAQAVEQGKQVLMLVPEIALTAQLVKRFKAWFGDEVAVAHSKLSQKKLLPSTARKLGLPPPSRGRLTYALLQLIQL